MRNLHDVINKMIEKSKSDELNESLLKIKRSIDFTAPELMNIRWNQVHMVMTSFTLTNQGKPEHYWQYEVISVFSTRSVEEIKSMLL